MFEKRRLVVVADVGGERSYHVGDEAMLEANLAALGRLLPTLEVTVVSPTPWAAAPSGTTALAGFDLPALGEATDGEREMLVQRRLALLASATNGASRNGDGRLATALAAADALIVSGGGNLHARWPELLYERVALVELASRLGKPVAFVGQTVGPELTAPQRRALGGALCRARWVGVRDLPSAAFALALGVAPERLDYQLDDAALIEPLAPALDGEGASPTRTERDFIAVTLHPFAAPSDEPMQRVLDQLAALAMATSTDLLFVPHDRADEELARVLAEMLNERLDDGISAAVHPLPPARVARWLAGQARMIVSSRYHPLVFGLSAGVPCLALHADQYGRIKAQGALRHAGQGEWNLSVHEAVDGALLRRALELWARRGEIRRELLARNDPWRASDALRWRRLLHALGLRTPEEGAAGLASPADRLLGLEPRELLLALASTFEDHRDAAAAEAERYRRELLWVKTTRTWRLRDSLVSVAPLRAVYRALVALSRGRASRRALLPPLITAALERQGASPRR